MSLRRARGRGALQHLQATTTDVSISLTVPLWVFRTVGAFPYREAPAPAHVYPLVLIVVVRLMVFGFLHSRGSA